jgi:hypothetical protein
LNLALACRLTGCGGDSSSTPARPATQQTAGHEEHKHGHHHAEHGPHHGTLVVVAGHTHHLELVLDADTGKLTGYVLDEDAKEAVAINQAELALGVALPLESKDKSELPVLVEVKLAALNPNDAGAASEFSGQSDQLKGCKEFDAVLLSIKIGGQEFKEIKFNFPKGNEDHHH